MTEETKWVAGGCFMVCFVTSVLTGHDVFAGICLTGLCSIFGVSAIVTGARMIIRAGMNQIEIKKVQLKNDAGGKRILVSFKFGFWMVYKSPVVMVYATITKPDGKIMKRRSRDYWPPWRGGYIGTPFKFAQKGTWAVHIRVEAKRAEGTEGDFSFECE